MDSAVDTSTTPGAVAGAGAGPGADTTSTTYEAAAVTSPTTTTAPAAQTTQTSTPLVADTSSSSSSPTALSESVASISGTSASQGSSSQVASDISLSTSSAASPSTTSNGLSTGAVVGIAVGCAVAGLVIGMLVAFLFFKRRSSKPYSEVNLVEATNHGKSVDSRIFAATPVEPASAVSDLDQFLLAPRPDTELAGELQSLGHLIQQHVEDHYHLFPVERSLSSLSQALADLGLDSVDDRLLPGPAELADMSIDPRTRHVALQHVISRVIFDSLAVKSTSKFSMLPPTVSSLMGEIPPCEKHLGNPEGRFPPAHRMHIHH